MNALQDHATAHRVNRWLLNVEAWVWSQANLCWVCGVHRRTLDRFCSEHFVLPSENHSSKATYSI